MNYDANFKVRTLGRSSRRGAFGAAIATLAEVTRRDAGLAFEFEARASSVLSEGGRFGLSAEHVTILRTRDIEDWRAHVDVADVPIVLRHADIHFRICERLPYPGGQLIDDVDVLERGTYVFTGKGGSPPHWDPSRPLTAAEESYTPSSPPGTLPPTGGLTLNQTRYFYQVYGCGNGSSFPIYYPTTGVLDKIIFLFGDTLEEHANDVIGWTTSTVEEASQGNLEMHLFTGTKPFVKAWRKKGKRTHHQKPNPVHRPGDPHFKKSYTLLAIPPRVYVVLDTNTEKTTRFPLSYADMEGNNIPSSGIRINDINYVVLKLGYSEKQDHEYSLLVEFDPTRNPPMLVPAGRSVSSTGAQIPISSQYNVASAFIKPRFHEYTLPSYTGRKPFPGHARPQQKWVLMWGLGAKSGTDAAPHLAMTRVADFPNVGNTLTGTTWYLVTPATAKGRSTWSRKEQDALPLQTRGPDGALGTFPNDIEFFSVIWVSLQDGYMWKTSRGFVIAKSSVPGIWMMLCNRKPAPLGQSGALAYFSVEPWGPWVGPTIVFQREDGFYSSQASPGFIHDPESMTPDGLNGPYIGKRNKVPPGAVFAPMLIEPYSVIEPKGDGVDGALLTVYFTASTWVPYYTVLMKATFALSEGLITFVPMRKPYPPPPPLPSKWERGVPLPSY